MVPEDNSELQELEHRYPSGCLQDTGLAIFGLAIGVPAIALIAYVAFHFVAKIW